MVRSRCSILGVALVAFVVGAVPPTAWAQADLLDKAKGLLGAPSESGGPSTLSTPEVANGLREALKVGTERVVGQLGRADGFNTDPNVHIPLPPGVKQVQWALKAVGMAGLTDDVELKLNRAAEAATPKAKALFVQAIGAMTLEDAQAIYKGPDDAATQYFRRKMSPALKEDMRPVINQSLTQVGAVQSYDRMMSQYKQLPMVPDAKAELTDYGLEKTLDGIFFYLAQEEKAIRDNPAARTTDLLKKVFGAG